MASQKKILDETDYRILMAIYVGYESCTDLSRLFNRPKNTITRRVQDLEKIGLTATANTKENFSNRSYELTPKTMKLISETIFIFNLKTGGNKVNDF